MRGQWEEWREHSESIACELFCWRRLHLQDSHRPKHWSLRETKSASKSEAARPFQNSAVESKHRKLKNTGARPNRKISRGVRVRYVVRQIIVVYLNAFRLAFEKKNQ
jgi:hypothetical protein